jgi:hypothetical protein
MTSVFKADMRDTLAYLRCPGLHPAKILSTNLLERLFKEMKWRTRW